MLDCDQDSTPGIHSYATVAAKEVWAKIKHPINATSTIRKSLLYGVHPPGWFWLLVSFRDQFSSNTILGRYF